MGSDPWQTLLQPNAVSTHHGRAAVPGNHLCAGTLAPRGGWAIHNHFTFGVN